MGSIRRSLAFSALDSYLALVLQLASTVIIARLLTPTETGIFAVAAVFASLASTFRDFGVAEFLIQEKELVPQKIRAALALNIMLSWAMGLLLFFGAPLTAEFYRTPGIADVMRVQAFNFALIPFGAVTMAWFRRELDFRPILIAGITANTVSFIVAVGGALAGLSYMSMAWSSLAGVAVTVGVSLWFRPASFPRWPSLRGVAEVFHFGKFASGIYIFGQLGRGAPEIIIGRSHDMASVAIFSRANGLVELFNRLVLQAISPVCMPYFARANREDGSLKRGYLASVTYLTGVGWPMLAYLGIMAFAAIRIIYGTQWTAAAPLARIVCAAGVIELVHHLAKEALIAQGHIKRSNLLQMQVQGSLVLGLLAVIPFGLEGGCWGLLGGRVAGLLFAHRQLATTLGLTMGEVLLALRPSALLSLATALPLLAWVAVDPVNESNFWRCAIGGGVLTILAWLAALRWLAHPLWPEVVRIATVLRARLPPFNRSPSP
ncbi:MAG: lipopolysaccharide biosynthesis protein [Burkholderiales bacterium]|nr:lipopolysaccharide biosynthesis protein [Burkholderiales bacterium]